MEYLLMGEKITINRSDGRVHTAEVVRVHDEMQSVLVSWREGFQQLGKEISYDCVMALNPQLLKLSQTEYYDWKPNSNSSEEEFYDFEPSYDEIDQ